MNITFMSLTEPKISTMHDCVELNKIDLSYMVCGRLFVALCQHYSLHPIRFILETDILFI